ncbi:MAG: hypothetical protein LBP28_05590 [Coriobacteriales bacterium]|jgi:hypothetical protein|nr:hypothetical protein [Coriobacteriales bacterium]
MSDKHTYVINDIEVEIDPRALDDVRTLRLLRDIYGATISPDDAAKSLKLFDLFDRILGDEQAERVTRELADADGYTSIEVLGDFIGGLFDNAVPKN